MDRANLELESIYRAAAGEIPWFAALATVAQAHDADRAMLFTPGLAEQAGGLCVAYDQTARRTGPRALQDASDASTPADRACTVTLGDGRAMPATHLVLFHARSANPLGPEERRALEITGRHLSIAIRLWFERRASQHAAEALAARLNFAALIADSSGRVTWMNARATAWSHEGRIRIADGKVVDVPELAIDLPRAIREATQQNAALVMNAGSSITAEFVPFPQLRPASTAGAGMAALVILRDRTGCREAAAALAANFRLTATEVDLALALWRGVLLAEYAAQRSVAMSTVRTQLKALLAKTRSRRQSDVVSIVGRMLPMVGSADVMADSHYAGRERHISGDTSNG